MGVESPQQLKLPNVSVTESREVSPIKLPVIHQSSFLTQEMDVPVYERVSHFDLPENQVVGENIRVPLTEGNIFRDPISSNLTEFGGSLQAARTLYETELQHPDHIVSSEITRASKTVEKTAIMFGYPNTPEDITSMLDQFSSLVTQRRAQREEALSTLFSKSKEESEASAQVKETIIYIDAKTAAD